MRVTNNQIKEKYKGTEKKEEREAKIERKILFSGFQANVVRQ